MDRTYSTPADMIAIGPSDYPDVLAGLWFRLLESISLPLLLCLCFTCPQYNHINVLCRGCQGMNQVLQLLGDTLNQIKVLIKALENFELISLRLFSKYALKPHTMIT